MSLLRPEPATSGTWEWMSACFQAEKPSSKTVPNHITDIHGGWYISLCIHTYIHTYIYIYIQLQGVSVAKTAWFGSTGLLDHWCPDFLILSHDIMCKNQCDARSEPCLSLFAGRQYRRRCEKVFMSSCSTSTVDTNWTWPPGSFQRDNSHLLKFTKGALKASYLEQNS